MPVPSRPPRRVRRLPWRALRRHATTYWAAVGALAVLTAVLVGTLVTRADAARRRWGETRLVAVAAVPLAPGHIIDAADARVDAWPLALVPDGARADIPVGRVVAGPVAKGEPLLSHHVAGHGDGLAALLPPGSRALAVPVGPAALALSVGDIVDLLASVDPSVAGDEDPTFPVAVGALVVDVADDAITVAVTLDEAPRVAFAVAHGIVTLALVPAG